MRHYLLIAYCTLIMCAGKAQTGYMPGGMYTIYADNDVAGYFYVSMFDQAMAKGFGYKFQVMDFAFRPTHEFTAHGPMPGRLVNIASNGTAFLMQFKGDAYGPPIVMLFDREGDTLSVIKSDPGIKAGQIRDELYTVRNGFLFRKAVSETEDQYAFVDNAGKILWSLMPSVNNTPMEWNKYEAVFCNDKVIAFRNWKTEMYILFSMETGRQIMEWNPVREANHYYPNVLHCAGDTIIMLGQYIAQADDYLMPVRPDGLFRSQYSMDGALLHHSMLDWASIWPADFPQLELHTAKLKDYVWIHQFMPGNQSIQVIGEVFDAKIDIESARMADYGVKQYVALTLHPDFTLDSIKLFHVDSVLWGSRQALYPNRVSHRVNKFRGGKNDFVYSVAEDGGPMFHSVFYTEGKMPKGNYKIPQMEAVGIGRDGRWHRSLIQLGGYPVEIIVLPARTGYAAFYEVYQVDQYTRYYFLKMIKLDL